MSDRHRYHVVIRDAIDRWNDQVQLMHMGHKIDLAAIITEAVWRIRGGLCGEFVEANREEDGMSGHTPGERCPYCDGDETKCDFNFKTEKCSQMKPDPRGQYVGLRQ
jgi:hypothetical protein